MGILATFARQIASVALVVLVSAWAAPSSASSAAEAQYQEARQAFLDLEKDERRKPYRDHWKRVIEGLERSVVSLPRGQRQCEALFNAGRANHALAAISYLHFDRREGSKHFRTLVDRCPTSSLADDALYYSAELWLRMDPAESRKDLERLLSRYPKGDMAPRARELLATLPPAPPRAKSPPTIAAKVPGSAAKASASTATPPAAAASPSAITASAPAKAQTPPAAAQVPAPNGPAPGGEARQASIPANEVVAAAERGGESQAKGAVVASPRTDEDGLPSVADILAALDAKGADAERPEDLALAEDLAKDRAARQRETQGSGAPDPERLEEIRSAVGGEIPLSLAAGLKVKRVVIDPGHGGKDTGAIGKDGTYEKDLTLAISQKLKARLSAMGLEVLLTRERDIYLSLEERTRFANENKADLFISIHVNAAENRKAFGIETYTLNLNSDRYAMRLAARENAGSTRSIGDLQFILADLATKANTDDSIRLARHSQDRMIERLRAKYGKEPVKDLGVKQALFFVLVGAKMPAILVETGFISNPDEVKRLRTAAYQDELAKSLADGVHRFIEEREKIARGELPRGATVF